MLQTHYSLKTSRGAYIDEYLLKYLNKRDGFFVEVGANDGVTQSNTCAYERELGWRGLLIDPSPQCIESCRQHRSAENIFLQAALVGDESIETVKGDFQGYLMSSVDGVRRESRDLIEVPAFTLRQVVRDHKIEKIDFMSLDVEGYEYQVLQGIDLRASWSPEYFLIEIYTSDYDKIVGHMTRNNYSLVECVSGYNKIDNPIWDGSHNDYLFKKN